MEKVREVKVGNVGIGGKNPIRIKGMLKSKLSEKLLINEAKRLEKEGAEIVRVAFVEESNEKIIKKLKKVLKIPLVADIHFNSKLAFKAMEAGVDGIRLNPLNISSKKDVKGIIKEAKENKISIRVGINSGGFKRKFKDTRSLACEMLKVVRNYLRIFEEQNFSDIIVSLKAESVYATVLANKMFREEFDYPLHIGVTATGPFIDGIIKSSLGIGILLHGGIGEVLRVSLLAPSWQEVRVAKAIVQFLEKRKFFPEIIACPTCSRCQVDLKSIVNRFQKKLKEKKVPFSKIALMGCVVNGPGEAIQADIGIAFAKKRGVIFKEGRILKTISQKVAEEEFLTFFENVIS